MEWRKILIPDIEAWEIQYDVVNENENYLMGRLVYSTEYGWQSVINGSVECIYEAHTEEDARKVFRERMGAFLGGR